MSESSIIRIENLRKVYRVGKVDVEALRGVDLAVERGEFLSIVGPSGSGKSTLFHVMGGLTPATSGRVLVDNQDLAQMSDAQRTRLRKSAVAFVFQKYNLLPTLSAADNIAIARDIAIISVAESAAQRAVPGRFILASTWLLDFIQLDVTLLIVWLGVHFGLKPLLSLRRQIEAREDCPLR